MIKTISESSKAAQEIYRKIWDDARQAPTNEVSPDWSYMLNYNPVNGTYDGALKDTYTLTATWFVDGEIKESLSNLYDELSEKFPFLKDSVLWQPIDNIHSTIFTVEKYQDLRVKYGVDYAPSEELVKHRLEKTTDILESITKNIEPVNMCAVGFLPMKNGTLCLKGVTDTESIAEIRKKGKDNLNSLKDPYMEPIPSQNELYHMVLGRIIKPLSKHEWSMFLDYVETNLYDHFFGCSRINTISIVRETKSFLSDYTLHKEIII